MSKRGVNVAKSKRRARGEGSVFQRKDGRWVVQIELGDGMRKQYYAKTQKEGVEKLKQAQRELEQGTIVTGPQQTVKQYLEYWLEEVHKPHLRVSSYVKYRDLIYTCIIPALGHLRLDKLTPQHVQSLYRQKEKDGLSAGTIRTMHQVLRMALQNALRWHLVSSNVCDAVSPPPLVKRETYSLSMEQAQRLLEVVRRHRLELVLTLALIMGMRRGKLLALRWGDIDLEGRRLQVRRTVNEIAHHGFVETEPKTAAGRRLVVLPFFVVDMLKQHRIQQLESRLKAGNAWEDRDLVFPNLHGGYFSPHYLMILFHKVLVEAGLPSMRFHDLRHSAATLLLSMGVHMKVVQEILGHSNFAVTANTYSHVFPSMQEEAMGKWDDKFGSDNRAGC
jgi:integrase